jgi:hypothetical protein
VTPPELFESKAHSAEDQGSPRRFSVSERTAAYYAMGVAVAAVAGLVISLVSHGPSTRLATIALILAVVAFGLQIAFFVTQLMVVAQQEARGRDTYNRTEFVLNQIQATTDETVSVIKDQFRFVLEHALGGRAETGIELERQDDDDVDGAAVEEAPGVAGSELTEAIVDGVERRMRAHIDENTQNLRRDVLSQWERISTPAKKAKRPSAARAQRQWPDADAGVNALRTWGQLSENAQGTFQSFGRELARQPAATELDRSALRRVLPRLDARDYDKAALDELGDRGLVTATPRPPEGGNAIQTDVSLTARGVDVIRLLTAIGAMPSRLSEPGKAGEFRR